jgi:hypothetical protein
VAKGEVGESLGLRGAVVVRERMRLEDVDHDALARASALPFPRWTLKNDSWP